MSTDPRSESARRLVCLMCVEAQACVCTLVCPSYVCVCVRVCVCVCFMMATSECVPMLWASCAGAQADPCLSPLGLCSQSSLFRSKCVRLSFCLGRHHESDSSCVRARARVSRSNQLAQTCVCPCLLWACLVLLIDHHVHTHTQPPLTLGVRSLQQSSSQHEALQPLQGTLIFSRISGS